MKLEISVSPENVFYMLDNLWKLAPPHPPPPTPKITTVPPPLRVTYFVPACFRAVVLRMKSVGELFHCILDIF